MSEVVYRSEVRIERVKGPVRKAYLPAERLSRNAIACCTPLAWPPNSGPLALQPEPPSFRRSLVLLPYPLPT